MALGVRDRILRGIGPSSYPEGIKSRITAGLGIALIGSLPTVSSLSSITPRWQSTLTITGANFGNDVGTVKIGVIPQDVLSWAPGAITIKVNRGEKPDEMRYGVYAGLVVTTVDNLSSTSVPVQLLPQAGWSYVNLGALAANADILRTEPALAATFQVAYGVTAGSGSLTVRSDGSFLVASSVVEFQAEVHNFLGWGRLGRQTFS